MEEEVIFKIQLEGESNAVTTIQSLTKANKELREERNRVNLQTEEGQKRVKEINDQINKNTEIIKTNTSALEKQRLNVGNYKNDIVDAAKETKFFGVSVDDASSSMLKFANPVTAAAGLVTALATAYLSSAAGARDLESAQTQLSTSFKFISNDIAKLLGADGKGGGLLSDLASQFNRIVFGLDASVRGNLAATFQNTLKELELAELDAKSVAKQALDDAEVRRRIRDDDTKSYAERRKAANEALGFIEVREQVLLNVQKEKLGALKGLLALDENNFQLQKEIKQVEFEIRDIREDSQGKRTEVLNAVNVLQKQNNEELREEIRLSEQLEIVKNRLNSTGEVEIEQYPIKIKGKVDEKAADKAVADVEKKNAKQNEELVAKREQLRQQELQSAIALSAAIIGLGEKETAFGKFFALTTIATNAGIGVSNAVRAGSGIPFPGNLAAILTGITAVLTGISQARGLLGFMLGGIVPGFASGGLSGTRIMSHHGSSINRSNGDNRLVTVRTGEVILNERQQAALGGARTFSRIGVPGFASGGFVGDVSRSSESNMFLSSVMSAIRDVPIYVAVEDINKGQRKYSKVVDTANVI